jgi:hypothetical protein
MGANKSEKKEKETLGCQPASSLCSRSAEPRAAYWAVHCVSLASDLLVFRLPHWVCPTNNLQASGSHSPNNRSSQLALLN